jgi:hypothetical protein
MPFRKSQQMIHSNPVKLTEPMSLQSTWSWDHNRMLIIRVFDRDRQQSTFKVTLQRDHEKWGWCPHFDGDFTNLFFCLLQYKWVSTGHICPKNHILTEETTLSCDYDDFIVKNMRTMYIEKWKKIEKTRKLFHLNIDKARTIKSHWTSDIS